MVELHNTSLAEYHQRYTGTLSMYSQFRLYEHEYNHHAKKGVPSLPHPPKLPFCCVCTREGL